MIATSFKLGRKAKSRPRVSTPPHSAASAPAATNAAADETIHIGVTGYTLPTQLSKVVAMIPYFEALLRFNSGTAGSNSSFNPAFIDLKSYTNLKLVGVEEEEEVVSTLWMATTRLFVLAVDGLFEKVEADLVVLGKVWISQATVAIATTTGKGNPQKRASPAAAAAAATAATGKTATIPKKIPTSTSSTASKRVPAKTSNSTKNTSTTTCPVASLEKTAKPSIKKSHSFSPATEPAAAAAAAVTAAVTPPPANITPDTDFLIVWQLLYSIADFLSFDALKQAAISALYSLSHDLDCVCSQCVGVSGVVMKLGSMAFHVVGLEEFVEDAVFVMAAAWYKVYAHAVLFPAMRPGLREMISQSVLANVGIENILVTLWALLDLRNRVHFQSNHGGGGGGGGGGGSGGLENLLVAVDNKVMAVLELQSDSMKRPTEGSLSKISLLKVSAANKTPQHQVSPCASLLQAVWDSDGTLKEWVARDIRFATGGGGSQRPQSRPVLRQQQQQLHIVETLDPAVEDFLARFISALNVRTACGLMIVLDRILQDVKGRIANSIENSSNDAFQKSVTVQLFGSALDTCLGFAAKRWINLGIREGQVPESVVDQLCAAAKVSRNELFAK